MPEYINFSGAVRMTCVSTMIPCASFAGTDEEANDAKALLQSKYPEYEISLTQKVDETLLGGYVIKTLNTEYDRSYEGKLRELERKLTRR
jgi:F-type H+-transporting ATPase subunit delta